MIPTFSVHRSVAKSPPRRRYVISSLTVTPYGPGYPGLVHPGFTHIATYRWYAMDAGVWMFGALGNFGFVCRGSDPVAYAARSLWHDLVGSETKAA